MTKMLTSIANAVPKKATVDPCAQWLSLKFLLDNSFLSDTKASISRWIGMAPSSLAASAMSSDVLAAAMASDKDEAPPKLGRVFFKSLISSPNVR